jgi:hypothetical protein
MVSQQMIQEYVDRFIKGQPKLREWFTLHHPENYNQIVAKVIDLVADEGDYGAPDPSRITPIDYGDYQGTLVFVIGANGYQPNDHFYVKVGYGSCSGCDTLQSIKNYEDDPPTESQVNDYMTLALHIIQGLKKMGDDEEV